jgi:hypothetical protein
MRHKNSDESVGDVVYELDFIDGDVSFIWVIYFKIDT